MTTTNDPSGVRADDLQFDEAEFVAAAPSGDVCELCRSTISGTYYASAGTLFCEACHGRIEAQFRGGTWFGRFVKAFILGSIAATVGSLVYYGVTKGTGWNIGLVAIVVGVMIGGAVKAGSGNLGGRVYQFLAVFLTYSAIAGMIIPEFYNRVAAVRQERRADEPKHVVEPAKADAPAASKDEKGGKEDAPKGDVLVKADPVQPDPTHPVPEGDRKEQPPAPGVVETKVDANAPPKPQVKAPAAVQAVGPIAGNQEKVEGEAKAKEPPVKKPNELKPSRVQLIFQLIGALSVLLGLVYAFPFFVAFHSPISGFIYGFALWEAWKINRKVELDFEGPFTIEAGANGGRHVV